MAKMSARKLMLCELLRLHFGRNNKIKKKIFWVRQRFVERHSKRELFIIIHLLLFIIIKTVFTIGT